MYRLSQYDVARRIADVRVRVLAQIGFGIICSTAVLGILLTVQRWVPLSGPFAFLFPAVVIATLYGHWIGGVSATVSGILTIWHFILPNSAPLSFSASTDIVRTVTAALVALIMLIMAESFRITVARHADARDREIERSEMLLRELEHRTRNNFALVASLLDLQRRQSSSPEVGHALDHAIRRVHTFADAYSQLGGAQSEGHDVEMQLYLGRLLDRVSDGLFGEQIRVESDIHAISLPSRTAVAIGLYLNEALTNCAKYAFPDGREGSVIVSLTDENGDWRLTICDDGVGNGAPPEPTADGQKGGLGAILFEALATQAGAKHQISFPGKGRRLDLVHVG